VSSQKDVGKDQAEGLRLLVKVILPKPCQAPLHLANITETERLACATGLSSAIGNSCSRCSSNSNPNEPNAVLVIKSWYSVPTAGPFPFPS